MLAMFV